ncbi:MAG TPA: DUF1842 domain-containing protein [Allosphingosinicella sp.]|jgi:hypothetical protein
MTEPVGLYHVTLKVSHGDMPGAQTLNLDLAVSAPTGTVHGTATITQALPPPYGIIHIPVHGQIYHTGFGQDTLLVHLIGQYVVSVPPPAIGSYLAHFSAGLAVDKSWNGKGSYEYGNHIVGDCKVTNTSPK